MAKARKVKTQEGENLPIEFDDALRKILKAPPQHKKAKSGKKKTGA